MTYAEMNLTVPNTDEYRALQGAAEVAARNYWGVDLSGLTTEEREARLHNLVSANRALWAYKP